MGGIYQAATLRSSVEGANTHTDVYSFRVLLLELCTRHPPYDPSIPPPTRARVVVRGRPYRPPPQVPPPLASVIRACWTADPAARLGFVEVVQGLRVHE